MKTGISINGREIDAPDHPTGNEPEYSRADLHVLDSVLCGGADRAAKRPALIDLISTAEKLRRKADDARRPEIRWWTTLGVPGSTDAKCIAALSPADIVRATMEYLERVCPEALAEFEGGEAIFSLVWDENRVFAQAYAERKTNTAAERTKVSSEPPASIE